jgi:iron(III) transport system ATP-binding protein
VAFLRREASLKAGDKVTLVLRQEDFQLVAADGPRDRPNRYSMAIERCVFLGERMEVVCRAPAGAGQTVSAYVNARAMDANASHVELHYPPEKIHCIEE